MNRRPDKSEVKLDGNEAFLALWRSISDGTIGGLREAA
jgi:hypothetical protein